MEQGHDSNRVSYTQMKAKAMEIETELKRLGRWSNSALPREKYEDMGAFGSNTMSFEEWLQFILIPRIHQIIETKDDFPSGSQLATYAIRVFDGDPDSSSLHEILYALDDLVNNNKSSRDEPLQPASTPVALPTARQGIIIGDTVPPVLCTLAELLPQFSGEDLESQLQTFDAMLAFLAPAAWTEVSKLLIKAAENTTDPICRERLILAARNVANQQRAAAPYDHEQSMKKYRDEFKKGYE
jgi:uncharacterized protein YqcC (DUF446 family)